MKRSARGLTLLEMVIVMVVLAAVASMAVDLIDSRDLQARYDDTKNRAQALRDAVVGRPDRTLNGQPELSGFVADMGRLPVDVAELASPTQGALAGYVSDHAGTGVGAGWRGPYVRATARNDRFLDGWGAPFGVSAPTPGALRFTSFGSDGVPGAGATWDAADYAADVVPDDYLVPLGGWTVTVTFNGSGAGTTRQVRLRLHYPTNGSNAPTNGLVAWPPTDPDKQSFLTPVKQIGAGEAGHPTYVFSFAFVDPVTGIPVDKRAPIGVRTLAVVEDSTGLPLGTASRPVSVSLAPRVSLTPLTMTWTVP